jgi:Ser/Thr protein kinase RdoA (MazF antagonist)
MPSQREQILFGLDHADGLAPEQKNRILQVLATLPDGESLCHGDFHPDNVLLTAKGPIIIDWMTGTRGNPAADLARSLVILETSALPPHIPALQRNLFDLVRKTLVNTYRSQYLLRSPYSKQELNAWQIPLLGARLFEVSEYPLEKALLLKRIDKQLRELEER